MAGQQEAPGFEHRCKTRMRTDGESVSARFFAPVMRRKICEGAGRAHSLFQKLADRSDKNIPRSHPPFKKASNKKDSITLAIRHMRKGAFS